MASYNNSGLFAPGTMSNIYNEGNWAFEYNTALDPTYGGNFEEDIIAAATESADESGYYSNDTQSSESSESKPDEVASYRPSQTPEAEAEPAGSKHGNTFYNDAAASNESKHGSDILEHQSVTHLEKGSSLPRQHKATRISKTVYDPVHAYESKTPHKFSSLAILDGEKRPFQLWEDAIESHERLAYRLERPSNARTTKRRKTSSKK